MKKVKINLISAPDKNEIHRLLKEGLEFPDSYSTNLDALSECLADIEEDTCVGLFEPTEESPLGGYIRLINSVFVDAEESNPHLCVFIFQKEGKFIQWHFDRSGQALLG